MAYGTTTVIIGDTEGRRMERAMSSTNDKGIVVQLAGVIPGRALTLEESRERCRTAPAYVRRSIDRYRIARGMAPLWETMPAPPATGE